MFRFLRDLLLRDCDTSYFGPAILQYVDGGIGNDSKTLKKPSNLAALKVELGYQGALMQASPRQPGQTRPVGLV